MIYTWPEMASVGITEEQAKERKLDYQVGKFPFLANGRAKAMDETEGLVKILADAKTDRVLGVHILGPRASDLIAEAVTTMEFAGSAEDIARTLPRPPDPLRGRERGRRWRSTGGRSTVEPRSGLRVLTQLTGTTKSVKGARHHGDHTTDNGRPPH